MSPEQEFDRPKAVTVIGWVWLVLAAVFLFRSVLNLILWSVLKPAVPTLLAISGEARAMEPVFLRLLAAHLTQLQIAQAIVSLVVGFFAVELLRLRPWARAAVEAVCWIALLYFACFAAFWAVIWPRISAARAATDPVFAARSYGTIGLLAGLGLSLALAAGLVAMISFLRSRALRSAFGTSRRESRPLSEAGESR